MERDQHAGQDARLAALAGTGLSRAEFLQHLLASVMCPGTVHGGGIWESTAGSGLQCCAAAGQDYQRWLEDGGVGAEFAELRRESLRTGEKRLIPCSMEPDAGAAATMTAGRMLVHWPLPGSAHPPLLELVFESSVSDGDQRGVLQFLQRAEPHWLNLLERTTAEAPATSAAGRDWEGFLLNLHRSLRVSEMCFTVANDGRRLIGCDRLCVLVDDGRRLRLASVSGVDVPDRRSSAVRAIESAAAAVARTGLPLSYNESHPALAPQLSEPLNAYADACQVRTALFMPLSAGDGDVHGRATGALIAEWFTAVNPLPSEPPLARLALHAATGLQNALRHSEVSWAQAVLPVQWARQLWCGGRKTWTTAVLIAAAMLAALLTFVPAPLVVSARGELQPRVRQHVYAPLDGIVEQVLVDSDDNVAQGATLLTMSNPTLDLEVQRVAGAIDTWTQKLASIGVMRLDDSDRPESDGAAERMSGDEAEIREELLSLRLQQGLLEKKRELLNVTSPIAGRVVTWKVREDLARRPVHEGERLVTVADVGSEWELELRLDERDAGHVVQRLSQSPEGLAVDFLMASRADETHHARLQRVATAVYWEREPQGERVSAPATAVVLDAELGSLRPGTSVLARIDCGPRSLGYVWFHSLYEAAVRQLWY